MARKHHTDYNFYYNSFLFFSHHGFMREIAVRAQNKKHVVVCTRYSKDNIIRVRKLYA